MRAGTGIPPARAPAQLTKGAAHKGRSSQRAMAMAQTVREKALIRQAREDGRPSEDDVAQELLGGRGQKGRPRPTTMTEDGKLRSSPHLGPGPASPAPP